MHSIFNENQKALITLPPKKDDEAEIFAEWDFSAGDLDFEGQKFIFPNGFHSSASARWLEDALLSVEISVSAEITAECARCLKATCLEISGNLMYLYYSRGAEGFDDLSGSQQDGFDDYMPVETEYFGRVLDIMPQIQESVFTLLPTKVLCKEDCKGLCPNCGADLNEGACSCKNEDIDPRLEALRNFVVDDKQ